MVPLATAVARPVLLIVATLVFEELQLTESVISTLVPSSSVPQAMYCTVSPALVESFVGVMAIDLRFATVTETAVEPLIVADVAVTLADPGSLPLTIPVEETRDVSSMQILADTPLLVPFFAPSTSEVELCELMGVNGHGVWQVGAPWHITKVPLPASQFGALVPGLRVHLPTTKALLKVQVAVAVPLDVPVRFPASDKLLPVVFETTVRSNVP